MISFGEFLADISRCRKFDQEKECEIFLLFSKALVFCFISFKPSARRHCHLIRFTSALFITMVTNIGVLLLSLLAFTIGIEAVSLPLPLRVVHQFSLPTYLNSIFVRPNGDIYVTTVWPNASIYCVSDANTDTPTASLVHTFDEINAATSIVETEPDVLAFLGGKQSSLGMGIPGTFGVWQLDLRPKAHGGEPIIQELVRIPEGGLLAGIEALPDSRSIVLVSDSTMGLVWRVDTRNRKYELAVKDDETMHFPPWAVTPFGINGLHILNGYLYWSNSYLASVYRIAITKDGYAAPGAHGELVKRIQAVYLDTFCLGPGDNDTIWGATDADNRLVAVTPDGTATFVAGAPDEMTLAGSVAPGFGTLPGDTDTLYVATSGAMVFPVNGTIIEGGKIVAVDTRGFLPNQSTKESRPVIGFNFPSGSWPEYLLQIPMRYLSYLLR
jgi:sugar lactone lactonase YvrE